MKGASPEPAVWFPAVRAGTGTDVFTERLVAALVREGIRAEITWLPHRAEYAPVSVPVPAAPAWSNVIHINSWLHPRYYESHRRPVVTTCHGCVHDAALSPYKTRLQSLYHHAWVRRLERRAFRRADAVTAVSLYTAERMHEAFGSLPVEVIPNWLPEEAFVRVDRLRPNTPFRLLYVGTWSRRKGVDLLPEIVKRLGDGFELRFTGAAPAALAMPPNMTALGWSSDRATVRQWMLEADALLFPSRMEGMPLAVLEAMACGLPVICSDSASLPEVVVDGGTGFICRRDDIEAFVNASRVLRDDPGTWRAMRSAASERAAAAFNEKNAVEAYLRLYRRIFL